MAVLVEGHLEYNQGEHFLMYQKTALNVAVDALLPEARNFGDDGGVVGGVAGGRREAVGDKEVDGRDEQYQGREGRFPVAVLRGEEEDVLAEVCGHVVGREVLQI